MNKQFADDLRQDLAGGLAAEWAEMYALDAVSEEERTTLEDYISEASPEVREAFNQRVRSTRETLAQAYATQEEEPPADLFTRIVGNLPAEKPSPAASPVSPAGDELAARRAAGHRQSPVGRWLLAAAAAVVVAVGGVTVAQNLQPSSIQEQVLQAGDVQREQVAIGDTGTADLAFSESRDAAVVTLDGVPAPPEGKVYQMWRLPADGASPESLGTMNAEDAAHTELEIEGIRTYSGLAITVEPEGGSETPTLPIVVEIPFDA
ncbi:anti-sigma factor [Arthrobacter tumbae]|uniref:anti-sigma factor n=1 Tax=Arthrobacter tumbae TaxID=163874 RepID=UPI001EF9242E|nr:anti-sigma factor [Arthrobacter tumbae]MBM7780167.1 anti-sigma-K factor RskA [Arthrobacter tumbae]